MTTQSQVMQNLLFFNYDLLQERMNSDISLEEQYVRAYIGYRSGNGIPGRQCFASVETIAKDLGLSENTTRKYLKILKAAKHIIELPSRSKYGTKQYVMNDNHTDWTPITNNFRNAFKNIEGIKTSRRKTKVTTNTVEADYNALSETQFLNPNSLKEFNYINQENSNFGTQQENYSLATEVIETPIGDNVAPLDFPPCPPPPSFVSESLENSDSNIEWGDYDLGFETSSNFGGTIYNPEPEPEPVPSPLLTPGEPLPEGVTIGSWDDDLEAENTELPEPVKPEPVPQSQIPSQPVFNTSPRPGKSRFDLTPDVEEQLTPEEKIEVTCELMEELHKAEQVKPEPVKKDDDKRTCCIEESVRRKAIEVLGIDAVQYLDYPYLLVKVAKEKQEEWSKQRAEKAKEIHQQKEEIKQLDAVTAAELQPVDDCDDWEDFPVATEPNPNAPPLIINEPKPEIAPPPYIPDEEPSIGLNLINPDHIERYLEDSNVFYNNDRRHYEIILREEILDRFFPIFADALKGSNTDIKFDQFIEFCMILAANEMGWETKRYNDGTVKKLIEPWTPSKFQGDKYREFSKEQLIDVAFRDNLELCEQCTFNDIMLQAEQLEFDAKQAGLSVEEYRKKLREEAAKQANEIAAKDENWEIDDNQL